MPDPIKDPKIEGEHAPIVPGQSDEEKEAAAKAEAEAKAKAEAEQAAAQAEAEAKAKAEAEAAAAAGDDTVVLPKAEADLLKKKAEDFDRSVELKRLAALDKKGMLPAGTDPELVEEVKRLREKVEAQEVNAHNERLSEAYKEFIKENPWADDDVKFDKIKENFASVGTETKEQLLLKLKSAAQNAFPVEYESSMEARLKSKLMLEKAPDGGGSSAPASIIHQDPQTKTQEEKMKEKMGSLFKKHIPTRYTPPKR